MAFALRNLSNNHRPKSMRLARDRRGERAGVSLPGPAMVLFSVGFPTGVRSATLLRPSEPASLFPQWAGQTATGRLHCSIQICLRLAQATLRRNRRPSTPRPPQMRLAENINRPPRKQAHPPCGNLWKAAKRRNRDEGTGNRGSVVLFVITFSWEPMLPLIHNRFLRCEVQYSSPPLVPVSDP